MIPQASAIPYRRSGDRWEFCLITSMSGRRWGFPKGIIDPGETPQQAALKEAHEEAGVHGHIVGEPLGSYEYSKWGTTLQVTVFLLEVTRSDEDWDERDARERRWANQEEVPRLLSLPQLLDLFDAAVARLQADKRGGR